MFGLKERSPVETNEKDRRYAQNFKCEKSRAAILGPAHMSDY